jgi:hypothetical protein
MVTPSAPSCETLVDNFRSLFTSRVNDDGVAFSVAEACFFISHPSVEDLKPPLVPVRLTKLVDPGIHIKRKQQG